MIRQKNYVCVNPVESGKIVKEVGKSEEYADASAVLVQVYAQCWIRELLATVVKQWGTALPKATVVGMTAANYEMLSFEKGHITDNIKNIKFEFNVIFFTDSSLCVHAFDCSMISPFVAGGQMGQLLAEEVDAKGVLLFTAKPYIDVEDYLAMAAATNSGIPFFGANGALFDFDRINNVKHDMIAKEMIRHAVRVLNKSKKKEGAICYAFYYSNGEPVILENGFVNVVFKGRELHICTGYDFGWTPIGKKMTVDKVQNGHLVERIGGMPASYVYKKYLGLRNDQIIVENVAEFPFVMESNDRLYARQGFRVTDNEDALFFTTLLNEGDVLRLSYGNPDTIFAESSVEAEKALRFGAQAIMLFACGNRSVLLGEDVTIEHDMFRSVAPELALVHGNGEILFDQKGGGNLVSALISVSFREGELDEELAEERGASFCESCKYRGRESVPLVHRLLTFLSSTSSELEDALMDAKAANKAKSAFLSNVSHEIRTPINAVLGLDEMILRESREKEIRRYALDIQNSGRTLLSLINDLLDSSRIESGKMELIPVEYDLSSMLNDLVNMTAVRAEEKNLNLVINVDETIPNLLYGDDTRLKQCVLNILTNAVKYTHEGSVTLDVYQESEAASDEVCLTFKVTDTGIGIKEENISHLFTAYERIDEARNHGIEGTGLGINIVTAILSMMDSKLNVESTYGEGSVFFFTVKQGVVNSEPIGNFTEMYERSVESAVNYREIFHAPDARILVVDDTRMNLTVIRGLLKDTQIGIDTAESGKEGLKLIEKKTYDIIFLDQRMPEMDGIETLHKMRSLCFCYQDNQNTPVIMLTADAVSGARERFLEEGFDDYLAKPVNGRKLEQMLLHYLPKEKVEWVAADDDLPPVENDDSGDGHPQKGIANDSLYGDSPFLAGLSKIPGLDENEALSNCMNEDILRETITDFATSAEMIADEIVSYMDGADWENYTVRVHALKSSARIIGADELSELAKYLEQCGDEKETDIIKSRTPELVEKYRDLAAAILAVLEESSVDFNASGKKDATEGPTEGANDLSDMSDEEFCGALLAVREMVEAFDYDGAGDILGMLDGYRLTKAQEEKKNTISMLVRQLDRDKILEMLTSFV